MSDKYATVEAALDDWMAPSTPEGERAEGHELSPEEEAPTEAAPDSELSEDQDDERPLEDEADSTLEDDGEPTEEHDTDDEDDESEDRTFTVIIDGEEVAMTEEQIRDGVMLKSDHTRKTQVLAEKSEAVNQQMERASQLVADAGLQLEAIDQMFFGTPPEQPPVDLMTTDPARYEQEKRFYEGWHKSKLELDAKKQEIANTQAQEAQGNLQKVMQTNAQEFAKHFEIQPNDTAAFHAKLGELQHFATTLGYSLEEARQIIDWRAYRTLEELKQLREAAAGAQDKARMKVKKGKVKPIGASRQKGGQRLSKRDQARQRFESVTSKPNSPNLSRAGQIDAALDAMLAKD